MPLVLISPIGLDDGFWHFGSLLHEPESLVYKLPGFGGRPRAGRTLSVADLADELVSRVPGSLDLVGASMGGMVVQQACARHPERVSSAAVACTGATVDAEAMHERARDAERLGMAGVLEATLERWFTSATLAAARASPGLRYARKALLGLDPKAFADGWRVIASHDARSALPGVRVPLTVVAGAKDVSAPPSRCAEVARLVPGARIVTLSGPHMLGLERGEELSAAVRDHLEWARR